MSLVNKPYTSIIFDAADVFALFVIRIAVPDAMLILIQRSFGMQIHAISIRFAIIGLVRGKQAVSFIPIRCGN